MAEEHGAFFWLNLARQIRLDKNVEVPQLTAWDIFSETDFVVQAAKLQCYGIGKLLEEGQSQLYDKEAGYELVAILLPEWRPIVVMKMKCTTTKQTHYASMAPHLRTVREALNWFFQVDNYLDTVGHQS
jgi:hypothetical protein